ncbi:MAG TPA: MlaD family protein [Terriglobales bacterium]|nr:MlaD family protein [Terriglobales bacterium]
MMTHEQKTRLGIFLAVASGVLIIALGFFIVPKLQEGGDIYFVRFRDASVSGLDVGSAVRYQGVDIGKVMRIDVDRTDLSSVRVQIRVQRGFPIKRDTTAVLALAGVTGSRFIDLKGGSKDSVRLAPRGEIPMGRGLEEKAGDIVTNIDTAVNSFNSLLSRENLNRVSLFLEKAAKSSEMISQVLEAKRGKLESSFDNVAKASDEFASVTENLNKVSANVSDMSKKIVASSEAAIDNVSKRFSDQEMGRLIQDLRTFLDSTSTSIQRIETSFVAQEDELRRAIRDLADAMDNLSRLTRELSEDPTALVRARKDKKK